MIPTQITCQMPEWCFKGIDNSGWDNWGAASQTYLTQNFDSSLFHSAITQTERSFESGWDHLGAAFQTYFRQVYHMFLNHPAHTCFREEIAEGR